MNETQFKKLGGCDNSVCLVEPRKTGEEIAYIAMVHDIALSEFSYRLFILYNT